jgi:hypothetical protein
MLAVFITQNFPILHSTLINELLKMTVPSLIIVCFDTVAFGEIIVGKIISGLIFLIFSTTFFLP